MNFIKVRNEITESDELINLDQITRIKAKSSGWFSWEDEIYFGDGAPSVRVSHDYREKLYKAIGVWF